MPLTDPDDQRVQRLAFFEGLTGKSYASVSRDTRSMLEFNFPGSDKQPINKREAARRLGVSVRTIERWAKGDTKPKPENLSKLTNRTRQSVTTKRGRAQLAKRMKQTIPPTTERTISIHGRQGITADPNAEGSEKPRNGYSKLDLTPEEQSAFFDSWAAGGDEGAARYLETLYSQPGRYVPNWHFHGIDGVEWR